MTVDHPRKPGPWADRALCIGKPEVFFGPGYGEPREKPRDRSHRIHVAQAICRTCPVRHECFQFARDNDTKDGIWGGVVFDKPSHNSVRDVRNRVERAAAQLRSA